MLTIKKKNAPFTGSSTLTHFLKSAISVVSTMDFSESRTLLLSSNRNLSLPFIHQRESVGVSQKQDFTITVGSGTKLYTEIGIILPKSGWLDSMNMVVACKRLCLHGVTQQLMKVILVCTIINFPCCCCATLSYLTPNLLTNSEPG